MTDITIPASLLFIDSLGKTLPLKAQFTYKELSDFCQREGFHVMAGRSELHADDLTKIAYLITKSSNNNIKISAAPTFSETRSPISSVDIRVATFTHEESADENPQLPPEIGARVFLKGGIAIHLVDKIGEKCVGIDDKFQHHDFTTSEIHAYYNLSEQIPKSSSSHCEMCGEDLWFNGCKNCGYAEL